MDGILNVMKEKGFTSHDVVAKLRGICKQRKIGHTGTLDPDAEGVLPVCFGKATKVCELLTDKEKEYLAVMKLGLETDTQDMSGQVLSEHKVSVSADEIIHAVQEFTGDYEQIPPMYSALKINGKKLYELAREGKEVERKARKVKIISIDIKKIDLENNEVEFLVHCSKGTYIRTLCYDIGRKLGTGACMKSLIRTRVGQFTIEHALTLSQIEQRMTQDKLDEELVHIEDIFAQLKKVGTTEDNDRFLFNGNQLFLNQLTEQVVLEDRQQVRVYDSKDRFIGIYEFMKEKELLKTIKMFL